VINMEFKAEVQKGGRVTIPAYLRKEFSIYDGDEISILYEDGKIKLVPQQQAIDEACAIAKKYLSGIPNAVDDFLENRRSDALREEEEFSQSDAVR
jgi:AbrB family looped-hinge helix DNA binding protein